MGHTWEYLQKSIVGSGQVYVRASLTNCPSSCAVRAPDDRWLEESSDVCPTTQGSKTRLQRTRVDLIFKKLVLWALRVDQRDLRIRTGTFHQYRVAKSYFVHWTPQSRSLNWILLGWNPFYHFFPYFPPLRLVNIADEPRSWSIFNRGIEMEFRGPSRPISNRPPITIQDLSLTNNHFVEAPSIILRSKCCQDLTFWRRVLTVRENIFLPNFLSVWYPCHLQIWAKGLVLVSF